MCIACDDLKFHCILRNPWLSVVVDQRWSMWPIDACSLWFLSIFSFDLFIYLGIRKQSEEEKWSWECVPLVSALWNILGLYTALKVNMTQKNLTLQGPPCSLTSIFPSLVSWSLLLMLWTVLVSTLCPSISYYNLNVSSVGCWKTDWIWENK